MQRLIAIVLVLACANCCLAAPAVQEQQGGHIDLSQVQVPPMNTNILLASGEELGDKLAATGGHNVLIDPSKLMEAARPVELASAQGDIEEDPRDRFITTRSGKRRPVLMESPEASEWAEEMAGPKEQRALSRVKRCGGGDDDDANRARRRRIRRARRNRVNSTLRAEKRAQKRARKAARRAARRASTTTSRTVIQNGQVVSKTVESTGPVVQSVAAAPVLVHQQPAAAVATHQVVQQPAQVVVAAPAPAAAPVVAPVAAPVAAAPVPSVAVQGSVKIN